ncbi:hypothetical protein HBDW_30350 [Herbaspirillum sp. DW155]|uniref:hypothetical protein n=1 Tax=Herbaspirillum sp. DW155 TaxID=3095609 RepID=UPI00308904D6|nr:hypothetical protein HBDW_30350 [Herbaspirillum sp. DW155]
MEELLSIFLRSLLEVVFSIFTRPFHGLRKYATPIGLEHLFIKEFIWFIGGCVTSSVALYLTNKTAISSFRFLTITLFLLPFASASLLLEIRHHRISPNSSNRVCIFFLRALSYSLGFSLIRFFFFPGFL